LTNQHWGHDYPEADPGPDGLGVLRAVVETIEAVAIEDDRKAKRKAQTDPLIHLYEDAERWAAVAAAHASHPAQVEGLVSRICNAATASLASQLRRQLRHAETARRERSLRLVGQGDRPLEVREALGWDDYPEGVVVPVGWLLTPTKLLRRRQTTQGLVEDTAGLPIVPTRRLRDVDTGDWSVELAWTLKHRRYSEIVPRSLAVDSRAILRLADRGLPVSSATSRLYVAWIAALEAQEDLPMDSGAARMGWVGRGTVAYLLGREAYQPRGMTGRLDLVASSEGGRQVAEAVTTAGTWEGWLSALEPCRNRPAPWLAVYAAASAPLLRILGAPNFGIDFASVSSSGKSTCLKLAASCYGSPVSGQGYRGWSGTVAGTEGVVGLLCDLPLCLDEGQLVPPGKANDAGALLHALIDGAGRQRGSLGRLGLQRSDTWRTVLLSTSEQGITRWSDSDGVSARVVEIHDRPWPEGCADEVEEVTRLACANHGHLYRRLIRHLVDSTPEARAEMRRWWQERLAQLARAAKSGLVRRAAQYVATIELAADLLHENLEAPRPDCDVPRWLWGQIEQSVGGPMRSELAWEALWAWVHSHEGWLQQAPTQEAPVRGWSGIDERDRVGLLRTTVDGIFRDVGIRETESVLRIWQTQQLHETTTETRLIPGSDNRLTRKERMGSGRARLVVVRKER